MRVASIALPFIVAVGLAAAVVSPAAAAPQSPGQCGSGYFCAWNGGNYTGSYTGGNQCTSSGYTKSLGAIGGGASARNARSSGSVKLYSNGSYIATLGPGAQLNSLSQQASSMTCYS